MVEQLEVYDTHALLHGVVGDGAEAEVEPCPVLDIWDVVKISE